VVEWILHENFVKKKKNKELLLMICSEGGSLSDAFALIDVINSSVIPIKTVGLGQIASAGLMIFLAGTRGRRVLTPSTSILSHQFSWGSDGKAHELFATVKEFELTQQRMINHYRVCTGLTDEEIRVSLLPPHDVYLTAEEALALHVCDAISQLQKS
jgi:ATP-dependent Clp protease protease subunit